MMGDFYIAQSKLTEAFNDFVDLKRIAPYDFIEKQKRMAVDDPTLRSDIATVFLQQVKEGYSSACEQIVYLFTENMLSSIDHLMFNPADAPAGWGVPPGVPPLGKDEQVRNDCAWSAWIKFPADIETKFVFQGRSKLSGWLRNKGEVEVCRTYSTRGREYKREQLHIKNTRDLVDDILDTSDDYHQTNIKDIVESVEQIIAAYGCPNPEIIIEGLKNGDSKQKICDSAGISKYTLSNLLKACRTLQTFNKGAYSIGELKLPPRKLITTK